jgi:hypothetical protein
MTALEILADQHRAVAAEHRRTLGVALEHAALGQPVPTELLDKMTTLDGRMGSLVQLEMWLEAKAPR